MNLGKVNLTSLAINPTGYGTNPLQLAGERLSGNKDPIGDVASGIKLKNPLQLPGIYSPQPEAFVDPNAEANKRMLEAYRNQSANRLGVDTSRQAFNRSGQMSLLEQLQKCAAGEGTSVAEMQFMKNLDQSRQALASNAASQRGVNSGLAARQLARSQADLTGAATADAAILRAQEQIAAEQGVGNLLNEMRQQDLGYSQLELQDQAQRDEMILKYMQLGLGIDQASFLAQQQMEELKVNASTAARAAAAQQQAAFVGAAGTLGSAALGMGK